MLQLPNDIDDIVLVEGENRLDVAMSPISVPAYSADLYGHISDAETGVPLEGAWVVISTITEPYEEVAYAITPADGTYRIEDIEPGRYWLIFMAAGYKEQVFEKVLVKGDNEINIALTKYYLLMSKDELYPYLIDGSVARNWWAMSYADRRQLGLKIIQWWSYPLGALNTIAIGDPGCVGNIHTQGSAACLQNALIRYCIFSGKVACPSDEYYWYWLDNNWHCACATCMRSNFSLPICLALTLSRWNEERNNWDFVHFITAMQVGESSSDFDSWIFFQYATNDIKPGDWQMGTPGKVLVKRVESISCLGGCKLSDPIGEWEI